MITFTQDRYIIPYTGFISLPVDTGYMILSKDDYDDILYVVHTVTEIELINRFGDPCKPLMDILPRSLSALAYLPSLLSFETDALDTVQLIGCCSVILINKRFSNLVELSADDFSVLRFSEYILKEYQIPWRHFLDTCILSDEFGKPSDTIPNKYVFLSLYPGQATIPPAMIPSNTHTMPTNPIFSPAQKEEWEEFAENPDMEYIGSGAFMHKVTLNMMEISGYDESVEKLICNRLKELGREPTDEKSSNPAVPKAEDKPLESSASNPSSEAEEIKRTLFNRSGS